MASDNQARIDELLANPNRQPADDAELDKLLHPEPVKKVAKQVVEEPKVEKKK